MNIKKIIESMNQDLSEEKLSLVKAVVGEPFSDNLTKYLKAFNDPLKR